MALDQNALMLAALQQRQQHPISPQAYSAAVQPPPAPAQVAGQVLPMTPHTNLPASELYDRLLQAPSGVQQLNRMQSIPPNVVPIPTEATQRMRMSENTAQPAWMQQPLRSAGGQYIGAPANLPLAAQGPAMFRNSMRSIGLSPPVYNKLAPGAR